MSVKGFQEFWLAGTRVYIERQNEDGSFEPMIDLGVIQSSTPTLTPEVVQLQDSDTGVRSVVDEGLSSIEEVYEVVCSNFNPDNLALFFLADGVQNFSQPATSKVAYLSGAPGRLLKIKTSATGDAEWGIQTIEGVYSATGTPTAFLTTGIVSGTKTISLAAAHGNVTAAFVAGQRLILSAVGLDNLPNAGTYEIASSAFGGGVTTIVVVEDILSDTFGGGTGVVLACVGGTVYEKGVDWDDHSLQRGIIRILPDGAIPAGLVGVSWSTTELEGQRLINPQTTKGPIKAKAYFVISRDNFARQSVREALVSITPSGMSLSVTEFSNMTLTFRVLNDLRLASPAGRLLLFRGSVPSLSDATEGLA